MNMKRRCLSLALSLVLAVSLCAPALAADAAMDQELTAVTLAVKKTLGVSGSYTTFNGTLQDMGVLRYWSLDWSDDEGGTLSVLASPAGKIMQYSVGGGDVAVPLTCGGYAPTLSKVTAAQAAKTASAFLGKVLTSGETAVPEAGSAVSPVSYSGGDFSFTAQVKLNGVPAPIRAQIQVSALDGSVTYFTRDDAYTAFVNTLPSAAPKVAASAAAASLAGTVKLELQYVSADDGADAVLRYVPVSGDSLYVDAQSGALVNLTEAWANLNAASSGGTGVLAAAASNEDSRSDSGLSEAEQAAIQKLKGVLSKDALDAAARKVTALGLSGYTLSSANYGQDTDTDAVTCNLWYKRTLAFSELTGVSESDYRKGGYEQFRSLTLDAKTGALLSGWGYRPYYMKDVKADRTKLQNTADAFLKLYCPDYASHVALYGGTDGEFQYDRKENGYFYHGNGVSISVDPGDGSVMSFSNIWSGDLKFQSAGNVTAEKAALSTYCGAYAAKLQYIAYPVSVDTTAPLWKTFADSCGTVAYRYVLGYTYETDGAAVLGVDAKSGKLIREETQSASAAYSDISSSYAKAQIQALADAGIRFSENEKFQPAASLTQKDLLVLLLNSCGYSFDTEALTDDALDQLYEDAWSEGFLTRGQRSPDHAVTRLELVKAIVSASPYGQAAQLKGIFVTSFRDVSKVASGDLGYLAIAQGLGMVSGSSGKFYPSRTATRQEAAVILYNYMSR